MQLNILGIRGIPAAHGGFESFVAGFAPYMRDRGHDVLVYCQADAPRDGERKWEDEWHGIHRVHFAPKRAGALGTMEFDAACVRDVLKRPGVDLVLGYNTALFNIAQRLAGRRLVMNMDGIEWQREKWSFPAKAWFFLNEIAGANLCSIPIADHPEIARHVARRSRHEPIVIPYGSERIENAPIEPIENMGLQQDEYYVSIARIEPENSIWEIVHAFSSSERRTKLVVLGKLDDANRYHRKVRNAAGPNVIFPGAIYDANVVQALRFHARAYLHGHTVGGTNPSLVEALGAGSAVIAHDNVFNRWVAGADQYYFTNISSLSEMIDKLDSSLSRRNEKKEAARKVHEERFTFESIHKNYEKVLLELDDK